MHAPIWRRTQIFKTYPERVSPCSWAPTCGNDTLALGTMLTTARALSSSLLERTKLTNSQSVVGSTKAFAPMMLAAGCCCAGVFVPSPNCVCEIDWAQWNVWEVDVRDTIMASYAGLHGTPDSTPDHRTRHCANSTTHIQRASHQAGSARWAGSPCRAAAAAPERRPSTRRQTPGPRPRQATRGPVQVAQSEPWLGRH